MENLPVIGLALGSGAARGLAHIGVLKALDENDIKINIIAGCSAGALIGSLYCCGISPKYIENIALQMSRRMWVDLTVPKRGFIKGNKIEEIIKLLTKNRNIEELDTILSIVATDLKTCQRVVFNRGPIHRAVRASISIPGVFVPLKIDNMTLVDGAVTDRVPASLVKELGADIVIAVDVGFGNDRGRINHLFDVILQSIDIMAMQIMNTNILCSDVTIEPPVCHISPSKFDLVEECVEIGYNSAMKKIGAIRDAINTYKEASPREELLCK